MPLQKSKQKQKLNFEAIGTAWQIDIDTPISLKVFSDLSLKIEYRISEFDSNYSRFRTDSWVSKISHFKGTYTVPPDFPKLYSVYAQLHKASNGLFNPLIGKTLEDAGYDANYTLKQKQGLIKPPDFSEIISFQDNEIILKQEAILDFGAAGKGCLVDIIASLLEENDILSYCIDAGGDILYKNNNNIPLRVGLEHPHDPTLAIGVAHIVNKSICGSSGNRRKWEGFHHTINPFTLQSPEEIIAVWTIADTAILADGLSTCLFLDPKIDHYMDLEFEYVIMYKDGSVRKSPNFTGELFTK